MTMYEKLSEAIEALTKDLNDCRNELCLKCGKYKDRHLGACDGCRWNPSDDVGEWIHSESKFWAGGGYTRCSKCGYGFSDAAYVGVDRFDYCPHCGKRMKSDNNI